MRRLRRPSVAAKEWGISRQRVYQLIKSGRINVRLIGGVLFVVGDRDDLRTKTSLKPSQN